MTKEMLDFKQIVIKRRFTKEIYNKMTVGKKEN